MKQKIYRDILLRYMFLIAFSLFNLGIFYFIFTPLTIYPVYFILNLSFEPILIENIIILQGVAIELIPACIAGAAYYLLFMLNLSTPDIKISKRIKMLVFAFGTFLILNVFRIIILTLLTMKGSSWFELTHIIFWYFLSTALVIGIWFTEVKIFKIKDIPFYSDIKFLYSKILK